MATTPNLYLDLKSEADQAETHRRNRDDLIVTMRKAGWAWSDIQNASGLSKTGVTLAARRANGGVLPKPEAAQAIDAQREAVAA